MLHVQSLESRCLLASQGSLDLAFGVNSAADTFELSGDSITATAAAPDGSVFLLADVREVTEDQPIWRVIKLTSDGKIDTSFDGDGAVELSPRLDRFNKLHAAADGKVVITGTSHREGTPTGADLMAIRLNANGSSDGSFGNGGTTTVDFVTDDKNRPINDILQASDVAADGSILLLSSLLFHDSTGSAMGIAMLSPDGQLDKQFFDGGKLLGSAHREMPTTGTAAVEWSAISFTNNGNAFDLFENLNQFSTDSGGGTHVTLARSEIHRFTLRGKTWRGNVTDGPELVLGNFQDEDVTPTVRLVARQADGGMIAVIESFGFPTPTSIVRITPSLTLDSKFGDNGSVTRQDINTISTLPDGRFYVRANDVVSRLLSDGKPDPLFATLNLTGADRGLTVANGDALIVAGSGFVMRRLGGPNIHLDSRGTLELAGTSGADKIEVFTRDDGRVGVRLGSLRASFAPSAVRRVSIAGYGAADVVRVSIKKTARIWGGDGNDQLIGGNGNDLIYGDAGDDFLDGRAGNDALYGHDGRDKILGGIGADRIFGNSGFDTIDGGDGDDTGREGDGAITDIEAFV
jgi:uncharacterized delta-60 repeat protein